MSKKVIDKVVLHAMRCPSRIASYDSMKHMCVKPLSFSCQPRNIFDMARIKFNVGQRTCKVASTSAEIEAIVLPCICDAAKLGDDSAIDRLLSVAANSVNSSCKDFGRTPLHYAALNGHHKVIDSRRSY